MTADDQEFADDLAYLNAMADLLLRHPAARGLTMPRHTETRPTDPPGEKIKTQLQATGRWPADRAKNQLARWRRKTSNT
jgi:hypothetical protein